VKLLLDQNLSPRLVRLLADVYLECAHVHELGMDEASDTRIWRYAAEHGYTIVSKGADFHSGAWCWAHRPR
jgi:predicted nuclease of predicted toxin-antitoxin system